jgi:hypothetical protein
MKRFLILAVLVIGLSSFCISDYPCHPNGDVWACTHPLHRYDYNMYGQTYPCTHPQHPYGDIYPCTHYCY